MNDDFVRFVHVQKSFGPKQVYTDLNLSVRRGEVLTLLGGSGTGKSVALKLLIGLLTADAGRIEVDGADVAHFTEEQFLPIRRRISMLFQSSALFDSLTVGENVAYPLHVSGGFSEGEIRDRVAERLEMVGLPGTENMKPSDLSGGMRKRVGLARAISADPEMILYDEPTTGLDPVNTRRINELILSIQARLRGDVMSGRDARSPSAFHGLEPGGDTEPGAASSPSCPATNFDIPRRRPSRISSPPCRSAYPDPSGPQRGLRTAGPGTSHERRGSQ